jgi:hypothetical protein
MQTQRTQPDQGPVVQLAPPPTVAAHSEGYEILVCTACGNQNKPRSTTTRETVPCRCGANNYRRLVVLVLEPTDLELLTELVERASFTAREALLEKLYAERRWVPAAWEADADEL